MQLPQESFSKAVVGLGKEFILRVNRKRQWFKRDEDDPYLVALALLRLIATYKDRYLHDQTAQNTINRCFRKVEPLDRMSFFDPGLAIVGYPIRLCMVIGGNASKKEMMEIVGRSLREKRSSYRDLAAIPAILSRDHLDPDLLFECTRENLTQTLFNNYMAVELFSYLCSIDRRYYNELSSRYERDRSGLSNFKDEKLPEYEVISVPSPRIQGIEDMLDEFLYPFIKK